jgi:heat shock protein HslJ
MWKTGLLAVAALLGLAACSNTTADTASDTAREPAPVGHDYVSTEVVGAPIPGGGPLELGFPEPDRATLFAGCNTATATVDLANGMFVVTDLESTLDECNAETIGADAWLSDLLQRQPTWVLDGTTLTLTAGNQIVTLAEK